MQVDLEVPTLAFETRYNPLSHTKPIYENIFEDEDEHDVALINDDITDLVCTVSKPLPEPISVG